ncbi:MAG: phosphopantothenoylcysteine decarboxylase [Planctomycetes bacterium]|jgi:phosphopantothenoylcysteine decarboxylase/phosphopantothenate--cysteine ligase|nr:phosphopantothenoylcysteine decarboxylase [Planctomycetota bacterium]HJO27550.1 flavoprotein [Planctomycetota bacterium]
MSKILLCCGASAALHKGCDLASQLTRAGHEVRAVLTPRATELVSPQLFEALTGQLAASAEFGPERGGAMDHIELGAWAQLVIVAPCTADLLGRMALGLGDDLLTSALLATPADVPRLVCPAMNSNMLAQPAVRRNLGQLREDGWSVAEPQEGQLACGVSGPGRMVEPADIVELAAELLER